MSDARARKAKIPTTLTVHEWLERIGQQSKRSDTRERRKANVARALAAHASHPGDWLFRWGDAENAPWMVNVDLLRKLYPALIDHPSIEELSDDVEVLKNKVHALERFREKSAAWFKRTGA